MPDVPKMRQLFQHKDGQLLGLGEDGLVYILINVYNATDGGPREFSHYYWRREDIRPEPSHLQES